VADLRLVVITGLSGAGKSEAVHSLEDLGFYCVDNLPPALIPTFAELCARSGVRVNRAALVVDIRGREFFDDASTALRALEVQGFPYQILFLEASNDTLLKRYKESRRRHPLAPEGNLLQGIEEERRRLEPLRGRAHRILDTTGLAPRQLRQRLHEWFAAETDVALHVNLVSFGFKRGLPLDADLVMDVRFLPNPHYVPSMRQRTGSDPEVADYVLRWPVTQRFLQIFGQLVEFLLPHYTAEGKSALTVAIGCTGGRHRSVVIAEALAERLRVQGHLVRVSHRDRDRFDDGADDGDDGAGDEAGDESGGALEGERPGDRPSAGAGDGPGDPLGHRTERPAGPGAESRARGPSVSSGRSPRAGDGAAPAVRGGRRGARAGPVAEPGAPVRGVRPAGRGGSA
jgi:UPF0042 nucleotide-binding protein